MTTSRSHPFLRSRLLNRSRPPRRVSGTTPPRQSRERNHVRNGCADRLRVGPGDEGATGRVVRGPDVRPVRRAGDAVGRRPVLLRRALPAQTAAGGGRAEGVPLRGYGRWVL